MFEDIKYAHFTVPHSGTRYINHAVQEALGSKIYQISNERAYLNTHNREDVDTTFTFCHIGPRWEDWLEQMASQPHIKSWITVRSPVHTWGTHFGHQYKSWEEGSATVTYEKLGQLRGQLETLMRFAPKVDHIHRVDIDDLSDLGDYLGLELNEHSNTFSKPSPMKKALLEQDVDEIERLCEGTDFWRAFHDYITPDIKDFFEDLGYDIWWYNG